MALSSAQANSWSGLPHKPELFVLFLCRVVDFTQIASFQTLCYYQLRSFPQAVSEETLSIQTGIALSAFTFAQCFTAVPWGLVSDAPWGGRKTVLLLGLVGTALSLLGVAFSRTFEALVVWRFVAGLSNGTVVAV
jgi:MFS family permease